MTTAVESNQRLIDRLDRLTRERIAPRAAEYDAAAQNPVESWRDLGREGFLATAIPAAYGGLGLDMPTYVAAIRTIARGCASTAMTVHMHSTVLRFIDGLGSEAQKRRYFEEVVRHGKLFGSWGSEPAVSLSRTFLMETVIREEGAGYVVDGVKYFCTMALGASRAIVWCALDGGTDMSKSLVLALVPADTPGIATDGRWNTLGMRATYSPSVTFTSVRVPRDAVLGDAGAVGRGGRDGARRPRQQGEVPRHRGRARGHLAGDPAGGRTGRVQGLPGGARVPRSAHRDADAPHHGSHARGHRQERARARHGHVQRGRRAVTGRVSPGRSALP